MAFDTDFAFRSVRKMLVRRRRVVNRGPLFTIEHCLIGNVETVVLRLHRPKRFT